MSEQKSVEFGRRDVIRTAALAGVALPVLAACGSGGKGSSGSSPTSSGAIAKTTDIPVGSGKIFTAEKVVVTQPESGTFKAFSAICTHQGCPVSKIIDKDIECTCHGSRFSIEDGSVVQGPATRPLEKFTATISGDEITVS